MSVSDDSNGASPKPKRDWPALRREYEAGAIGYRRFAKLRGIPPSTLNCRILKEKWVRNAILVKKTANEIDARLQSKVKEQIESQLAPWIEAEKLKFTKRGVKLAKRGLSRVERFFTASPDLAPKDDAFVSKTAETYHRIGRVALGMSDGQSPATALTLNLLGNHQAVQIVSPNASDVS